MNRRDAVEREIDPLDTKSPRDLDAEVRELFDEPRVPNDIGSQYLLELTRNLTVTEKAMGAGFLRLTLAFLAFLLLDSGLVEKLDVAGAELRPSGVLLLAFPVLIAFETYQLQNRVVFAHELRTTIALLYRYAAPAIYRNGLDLLTHYPSARNIESYYGKIISGRGRRALDFSTTVVTIVLGFLPVLAVVYCFVRSFLSSSFAPLPWLVAAGLAGALLVRTVAFELLAPLGRNSEYYARRGPKNANEAKR